MTVAVLPVRKREWSKLITDLGLRPNKGRGQNFLFDQSVIHRIVKSARVNREDHVLEIGAGLGILTQELMSRAGRVTAIEIESVLAWHLRSIFATRPNFELFESDALRFDLAEAFGDEPIKVVANLPYSAASAIVRHVLESDWNLTSATVMVQLEVGERMLALPPNMSILSIATQVYSTGKEEFLVPPDVFIPNPAIDSLVVTFTPHTVPIISTDERSHFFDLVNSGFRHKRKNIANSLSDETRIEKGEINAVLELAGIEPTRRAQTLSVAEWVVLSRCWPWTRGNLKQ